MAWCEETAVLGYGNWLVGRRRVAGGDSCLSSGSPKGVEVLSFEKLLVDLDSNATRPASTQGDLRWEVEDMSTEEDSPFGGDARVHVELEDSVGLVDGPREGDSDALVSRLPVGDKLDRDIGDDSEVRQLNDTGSSSSESCPRNVLEGEPVSESPGLPRVGASLELAGLTLGDGGLECCPGIGIVLESFSCCFAFEGHAVVTVEANSVETFGAGMEFVVFNAGQVEGEMFPCSVGEAPDDSLANDESECIARRKDVRGSVHQCFINQIV